MSIFDSITQQAGRLTTDVQNSLKRARIEGERRVLQRQYRAALEDLGERTYALVQAGSMPGDQLGPEVAAVESRLMEIEAKAAEIDALQEGGEDGAGPDAPAPDDSEVAFPMVAKGANGPPRGGAGPGWEAADRFFAD